MIEVKIPQEIKQYDAKIVGPFSGRQALFGGCAVGIGYLIYNQFHTILTREQLIAIIFFLSVPFGLLGWARPYGMRFAKFFFGVLLHSMLHSSKRYFRSDNILTCMSELPSPEETWSGQKKRKDQRGRKESMNSKDFEKARKKYRKHTYP